MADLITISDQASKSIREDLFPTLQENWWRTSDHPILQMLGMEVEDQTTGLVNSPRVKSVPNVGAGRQIEVLHEHSLFGGGYAVAENTSLKYGKRAEDRSLAKMRFYEGAFKISRQDIAANRDSAYALVEVVGRHAKNALHQAQRDVGRMTTYLKEGQLAIINGAVTTSSVVTVDNAGTSESEPTRYLRPTKKLWIGAAATIESGSPPSEVEVAGVRSSTVFTLTATGSFTDNHRVVSSGVYSSSNSEYLEFETLDNLINNTGTVQNVNKATNYWAASYVAGSIGTLALTNIDQMAVNIRNYAQTPGNMFMLGNNAQWRRYSALLTATKRVSTVRRDFDGIMASGAQKLTYFAPDGETPLFLCDDVPDGYIYAVNPDAFFWAEMLPMGFSEDALSLNGTPGQRISGSNNYEFAFRMYGQFVQTNAKACGRLTGITA